MVIKLLLQERLLHCCLNMMIALTLFDKPRGRSYPPGEQMRHARNIVCALLITVMIKSRQTHTFYVSKFGTNIPFVL